MFGYGRNAVLERKIDFLADNARVEFFKTGSKSKLFDDVYYKARSWKEPQRIIMKAEHGSQGTNQRFLISNMEEEPEWIYSKFYVQRAEDSENRIKELKLDIKSDRLSCHNFVANQFRLFLHQAAYYLMQEFKKIFAGTKFEKSRITTLREKLIKIAVRVKYSVRRIYIQFANSCPVKQIIYDSIATLSTA